MQINYEYYRVFYYVAKYRNFTQAARALISNQPNVTRVIKNLESELGCMLFIRSNRGVTLTPEGELLYAHVSVAFEQIQAGEEELFWGKNLHGGSISVGASETALHSLLLPILHRFHQRYPKVRLRIFNYTTPQAILALKNGLVDLAVVTTPTGVGTPLIETPLKSFRELPVCGEDFRQLARRRISISELAKYPLVSLSRDTKTYEFYHELFLKYGITFMPDIEVATADQILPMIKNDLGIGFVPEALAAEDIQNGKVYQIKLEEPVPERTICLLKCMDRLENAAAREFEQMLSAEVLLK